MKTATKVHSANLQEILNELDTSKEEALLEDEITKSPYGALLKDNPSEKELRDSQKALDKLIKESKSDANITEYKALQELMGEKIRDHTKGKGISGVINLVNKVRTRRIDAINNTKTGKTFGDAIKGDIEIKKKELLQPLKDRIALKQGKKIPGITSDTKLVLFFDSEEKRKEAKDNGLIGSILKDSKIKENEVSYIVNGDDKTIAHAINRIVLSDNIQTLDFTENKTVIKILGPGTANLEGRQAFVKSYPPKLTVRSSDILQSNKNYSDIAKRSKDNKDDIDRQIEESRTENSKKSKAIAEISENVTQKLFGENYASSAARVKDAAVIKEMITEAFRDASSKSLADPGTIGNLCIASIEAKTEPTKLGNFLNYFYESEKIQLKSPLTDKDRAECIKNLKKVVPEVVTVDVSKRKEAAVVIDPPRATIVNPNMTSKRTSIAGH